MMKKLLVGFGIFLLLLTLLAVVVPFIVDVDRYRPQIVQLAKDHLNGELRLGKLNLSLWGQVLVNVDGVELIDSQGQKVLSVKEAHFHLPFLPILTGSPRVNFRMVKPEIQAIRDKSGHLNLLKLRKTATDQAATPADSVSEKAASTVSSKKSDSMELPAIALNARLGIELVDAFVSYRDMEKELKNQIRNLNVRLVDLSLTRTTEMEIWADIDTRLSEKFLVRGPFRAEASLSPRFSNQNFESILIKTKVDLGELVLSIPGTFTKGKGVVTTLDADLTLTPASATIQRLQAVFHNAQVDVKGALTQLNGPDPVAQLQFNSNSIEFSPWVELLPMIQEYELGGSMSFQGSVNGPASQLGYEFAIRLASLSAKAPKLKAKPVFDGELLLKTDRIEKFLLTMKAPGNELKITGKVLSFSRPKIQFGLTSSGLDLDQLVEFSPIEKQSEKSNPGGGSEKGKASAGGSSAGRAVGKEDFDAQVADIRKNEVLKNASGDFVIDIKKIKAREIVVSNFLAQSDFKNLTARLKKMSMKVFSGKVHLSATADLKPTRPAYTLSTKIDGLDLKQAVTSQLALFKNTVYGTLFFSMNGKGASFNVDVAKKRLNVRGKLRILDATFTSIDVGKMVTEGLNGSIEKLAKKYPRLGGKTIKGLPGKESRYQKITSDFSIVDGNFNAPNFTARSEPKKGVDLEGRTRVGLLDESIQARWVLVDRYNLTKAGDLGVDIAGTEVKKVLASGNPKVVRFPVTVRGTLSNPKYGYGEVASHLSSVAVKNTAGAAKSRAQAEVKKRAGKQVEQIKKSAPKQVKDALKRFGF